MSDSKIITEFLSSNVLKKNNNNNLVSDIFLCKLRKHKNEIVE